MIHNLLEKDSLSIVNSEKEESFKRTPHDYVAFKKVEKNIDGEMKFLLTGDL